MIHLYVRILTLFAKKTQVFVVPIKVDTLKSF